MANPELADQHEQEPETLIATSVDGVATAAQITDLLKGASAESASRKWPKNEKRLRDLILDDHQLDTRLKKMLATWAVWAMVAQIVVADLAFFLYSWLGEGWADPGPVIIGWLSATVVQVIGIVFIVARYLFPDGGNRWSHPDNE